MPEPADQAATEPAHTGDSARPQWQGLFLEPDLPPDVEDDDV
ncbi:hypothetical protein ACWCRD_03120 [Streptomyces sp. NPDC002092]